MDDIDILDKKLKRIAQSTQTFFPAFIKPHDWLRMHSRVYYKWHTNPVASLIHIVLLLLVTTFNLLNLASFIVSYPSVAVAASQTWTSQSDWNGWSRSNTTETLSPGSLTLTSSGGGTWSQHTSGDYNQLNGIWAASSTDVWAVGNNGAIIHYNGSSWSAVNSPTSYNLNDIYGFSSSDIWAVGNTGTVIHYNGSSWSTVTSNAIYTLRGIWGPNSASIWAVGDMGTAILYNGTSWTSVGTGQSNPLYGVWGSSSSDVWAVGTGGAMPTTVRWNGSSWNNVFTTLPTTGFYGVWGTSSSNYHATTATNAQAHYGGSSWAYTYGAPNNAATRYGIWGSSASDIWAVGVSGAIDHFNGSSWSASNSNTSVTLRDVGGSGSDVWAVGDSGLILHYGSGYSSSGTATKILTPSSGKTQDWQSATVNKTTNGQTATVQYTTNTNCSSSLTTDITSLSNSESICIKISLSTSNSGVTPSVEDITVTYTEVSSGGSGSGSSSGGSSSGGSGSSGTGTSTRTASPSPSPSSSATPTVTRVAQDSCTTSIKDIVLTALDTNARLTFNTTKNQAVIIYVYPEARAKTAGKPATGYDTNSTILSFNTLSVGHDITIPNLNPSTTYYYTITGVASAGVAKTVSCEYNFTTVAPPQVSSAVLTGNIFEDGTTTPISGVGVVMQRKSPAGSWASHGTKTTDATGNFSFDYTPTDSYLLTVSLPSGYYYGLTRQTASCQATPRGTYSYVWENGLTLPPDGCRVAIHLLKISDSFPTISGKILQNGTTTGVRDTRLQLSTTVGGTATALGYSMTNENGEWSFKYPPGVPIAVTLPSDAFRLAGPTKAIYGCPGDNNATTNALRWYKVQPPTTGCQNNNFYVTVTQPIEPPLSGVVKDAVTGAGVADVRIDVFTQVNGKDSFATRRYTDQDGRWRVLVKPNETYRIRLLFDTGHTLGYIAGPQHPTTSCGSSRTSASDITLKPVTSTGCQDINFTISPLAGTGTKTLSGYTLNSLTQLPVANTNVKLFWFDTGLGNWRVAKEVFTTAKGQWSFSVVPGQQYFVETKAHEGYMTGFKQPTSTCNTEQKYVQRLTWMKNILQADCQSNVLYMMPADGKITGKATFPNSTTPFFNSFQRLWRTETVNKRTTNHLLDFTYTDNQGRFSLNCRRGIDQYRLKQDPAGVQNTSANAIIDTDSGTRTISDQSRNNYIPIQMSECRELKPLQLTVAISPNGGTFAQAANGITLSYTSSDPNHDVEIHYTLNGDRPTLNSPRYRGLPISFGRLTKTGGNEDVKVRAIAFGSESEQAEATFTLTPAQPSPSPVASPSPSPSAAGAPTANPSPSPSSTPGQDEFDVTAVAAGDIYTEPITVTLSTNQPASSDITILYSTNGSDPLTGGTTYTAPIVFNSSVTLNYIAKKTSTGQQTALKTDVYTFPETEVTHITWTPQPGDEPIYTISCNGEAIAETTETSYDNPVRQLDGCVYTITAKDKDGDDLGEVKGIAISAVPEQAEESVVVPGINVTVPATVAAAGAAAAATAQPGILRTLALIPFLLHSLWLWLASVLGLRKKHSSWGKVYETALDAPIVGAIVSFYRADKGRRQLIDRQLSDKTGHYGFLVSPGQYTVSVQKTGFVFPSKVNKSNYAGTIFSIANQHSINLDLAMDPYELSSKTLGRWRAVRGFLEMLNYPILVAGTALTAYDLYNQMTAFGWIIMLVYIGLWANKISTALRTKKKK